MMDHPEYGNVTQSMKQTGKLEAAAATSLSSQSQHCNNRVPQQQVFRSSSSSSSSSSSLTTASVVNVTTATVPEQQRPDPGQTGVMKGKGGDRGGVRVRNRPQIPPKPQMDAVRYSMANVQESCDWELDTLLGELSALELQLTTGGDQALLGFPTLPTSASRENSLNQSKRSSTISASVTRQNDTRKYGTQMHGQHSHSYNNFTHGADYGITVSANCPSPDRDSAFGDSSSTESRNNNQNCRNSTTSISDSCRGSLNTPSPTQQASPNQSSSGSSALEPSQIVHQQQQQIQQQLARPLTAGEIKAAKIREALEKMREADIKKVYVKFFIDDGSSTVSLLIDERWTVAECIRRITLKLNVPMSEHHAIVEEYPELYIKRIYEDHEYLVENIMMWTLNSQNKLYFTQRLDKYSFLDRPEEFLVTQKNIDFLVHGPPSPNTKRRVVREFFEGDNLQPPETEGWLLLKSDGKKSWKRHFFVLRSSGLYYCAKGKSRNSKDLQCLMNMQTNQVYSCTDWKKKYKAPSNFGFAIKHPKIQMKASKFIKYVCTDDVLTYHKWMVALRIAKNGRHLYENYLEMCMQHQTESSGIKQPMKIGIPQISPTNSSRTSFIDTRKLNSLEYSQQEQQRQQEQLAPLINVNRELRNSTAASTNENSTDHNSIIFDQCDDVMTGTIKRAPCDLMLNSKSIIDRRCSSNGIASPSGHSSGGTADSDSDEEQFPPPPSTVAATASCTEDVCTDRYSNPCSTPVMLLTPRTVSSTIVSHQLEPTTIQQPFTPYYNGHPAVYNDVNCGQPVKSAPVPPVKPQILLQNWSEGGIVGIENRTTTDYRSQQPVTSNTTLSKSISKKVVPPPPPKRSDTTKLQSVSVEALHSELEIVMARRLQKIGQL